MIDIYSKGDFPSNVLSNFASNDFIIDGVECASMEGFLQSLKFHGKNKQRKICHLTGKEAKNAAGKLHNLRWKITQTLYWNGRKYKRESQEYLQLITRAYDAIYQNEKFRKALVTTGNKKLCHSIYLDRDFDTK